MPGPKSHQKYTCCSTDITTHIKMQLLFCQFRATNLLLPFSHMNSSTGHCLTESSSLSTMAAQKPHACTGHLPAQAHLHAVIKVFLATAEYRAQQHNGTVTSRSESQPLTSTRLLYKGWQVSPMASTGTN